MNTCLAPLFGLEGNVAPLTGASGHLVGELWSAAGLSGTKVVYCYLRLEDVPPTTNATEATPPATSFIIAAQSSFMYH